MTWLAWRQLRIPATVVYAAVAVLVLMLLATARSVSETTAYSVIWASVVAAPGIIGVFWGAPLIARELEQGTHKLAWTQSISRTRWLATKLGLGVLAAMAAAGLLSVAATWWCHPIDATINAGLHGNGILGVSRMEPPMFIARGIAPIGYVAFAFVLGAAAGLVVRRTVPAMAVTLVVFVGVMVAMPIVRAHFAPKQLTTVITQHNLDGLILTGPNSPVREVRVAIDKPGAWVTSNQPVDPSGRLVDTLPAWVGRCLPPPPAPGGSGPQPSDPARCFARLAQAGYRQRVTFQPASRYWTFQAIETAIFLALAGLMAGVCFWRIRRLG